MTEKSRSQFLAENLELRVRLADLEARLAARGGARDSLSQGDPDEPKLLEGLLKASEVRYRRLFETAKDGILILDADTGRIADSNPFLEQMLGYEHAELDGKYLWDIGAFKDTDASQVSFKELQSREYIRYENLPLETKAGDRIQVEFVSNVYLVDSIRVIQCNIRDITARKLAEARVQEAYEKLSSLVATLQRREAELVMLNRYNDLLQTCETQDEAFQVVGLLAGELFAGLSGSLAVFRPDGRYLETVSRWGTEKLVVDVYSLEDCWAIRRGRPHEVMEPENSLLCRHFIPQPGLGYLCLPLTVQGETLGVFHLGGALSIMEEDHVNRRQLALTVGEAIKLSLANLKLRERLHDQATRDPLTGLFNRRYLSDTLPRELHRALRSNVPLCVAMLDLDNFKRFNDAFGHEAGDLVLRESSRVLQDHLRKSDIACRYGGEEFLLVLPDSRLEDALRRLEQVRLLFEGLEIHHGGQRLDRMTVSVGIAAAPEHGTTQDELVRAADEAVYAAKQAGRNCIATYQRRE